MRPLKANGKRIYMIIEADARAVRPYILRNNQLLHPFTRQLPIITRADVRAVLPYMHQGSSQNEGNKFPIIIFFRIFVGS